MSAERQKVLEILAENCPNVNLESETSIVTGNQIDSIELVQIISDLEEVFGIEIAMEEVVPENFDSVDAILEMIHRLA